MTEQQFAASRRGHLLVGILQQPEVLTRMVAAANADRPAVEVIDPDVAALIGALSDDEKKAAGRVVKRFLAPHGLRPFKKGKRVLGGKVFSRGTVYRQVLPPAGAGGSFPSQAGGFGDPIAAAKAILAAGRLDNGRQLDTVEDFLAERRAMWGDA
ncbi:hypothetical protein [Sandarakinorhabdus sp.]|uniref:hypothetical protein n=1 Tax=Sandarakinorhabdus sp. TaxID=1916663 RepID=UPI00333F95A6